MDPRDWPVVIILAIVVVLFLIWMAANAPATM